MSVEYVSVTNKKGLINNMQFDDICEGLILYTAVKATMTELWIRPHISYRESTCSNVAFTTFYTNYHMIRFYI